MLLFYHIWLKTVWIASPKEHEKKRRERKKWPALAKITREINRKRWTANHHYIYLENRIFSTWRKVHAEGTFVNDLNFVSRLLGLELR